LYVTLTKLFTSGWAVTTCHRDNVSASAQNTLQSIREGVATTNTVEGALHIYSTLTGRGRFDRRK
jgi:hypothetical protein